jgi:hypothetical protein
MDTQDPRLPQVSTAKYLRFGPIEKYYGFCDLEHAQVDLVERAQARPSSACMYSVMQVQNLDILLYIEFYGCYGNNMYGKERARLRVWDAGGVNPTGRSCRSAIRAVVSCSWNCFGVKLWISQVLSQNLLMWTAYMFGYVFHSCCHRCKQSEVG